MICGASTMIRDGMKFSMYVLFAYIRRKIKFILELGRIAFYF
jgi:hypothetical protein